MEAEEEGKNGLTSGTHTEISTSSETSGGNAQYAAGEMSLMEALKGAYDDDFQYYKNQKTKRSYIVDKNGQVIPINLNTNAVDLNNGNVWVGGKVMSKRNYAAQRYVGTDKEKAWKQAEDDVINTAYRLYDNKGQLRLGDLAGLLSERDIYRFQKANGILATGFLGNKTWDKIREKMVDVIAYRERIGADIDKGVEDEINGRIVGAGSADGDGAGDGSGNGFNPIVKKDESGNATEGFSQNDFNELVRQLKTFASDKPENFGEGKVLELQKLVNKYRTAKGLPTIKEDGLFQRQTLGAVLGELDDDDNIGTALAREGLDVDGEGNVRYHRPSLIEYLDEVPNDNDALDFDLERARLARNQRINALSGLASAIGDMVKANAGANVESNQQRLDSQQQLFEQQYQNALHTYQAQQEKRREEQIAARKAQEEREVKAAERAQAQANFDKQYALEQMKLNSQNNYYDRKLALDRERYETDNKTSNAWLDYNRSKAGNGNATIDDDRRLAANRAMAVRQVARNLGISVSPTYINPKDGTQVAKSEEQITQELEDAIYTANPNGAKEAIDNLTDEYMNDSEKYTAAKQEMEQEQAVISFVRNTINSDITKVKHLSGYSDDDLRLLVSVEIGVNDGFSQREINKFNEIQQLAREILQDRTK